MLDSNSTDFSGREAILSQTARFFSVSHTIGKFLRHPVESILQTAAVIEKHHKEAPSQKATRQTTVAVEHSGVKFGCVYWSSGSRGGPCKPSEVKKAEEPLVLLGVGLSALSLKEAASGAVWVSHMF